ncbi:MAG: 8-oxoguanine deaminase [Armatimonadota bacterium]|nr:8-oxoguanine deaminase [Armatimonadota bacterium]MDR7468343.1 8-oxoguanine deaminase [Armatimonadota bacterium]MDR7495264.1 8-oxoguanine deaminase [Armatimonadota bacterium]MDR7500506.1 8-oxoguanine deaminase [Armatimonadota bacterium]MDR7503513.1 8-oxoguanine deaminase [Armatimonadota bacterium]
MSAIRIDGCEVIVTMDDAGREIAGGSLLIRDGVIAWVGAGEPPADAEADAEVEVIDASGMVALPGLVNAHHHLYQSMTRVRAQEQGLFGWLQELYPVWAGLSVEWMRASARAGLAELALSGCSTTTDHHYIFPRGAAGIFEAEVEAARELGLRFHPCRGSMDLGQSRGGLPPDGVVEEIDDILSQTADLIRRLHDPAPGSMLRIAVAPCSPFSVSRRLMEESRVLARRLGVRLHTHIAETLDEERFCLETFHRRPVELLEDLDWLGPDVWLAHCVHVSAADIDRLARTGTAVAWCPTSNLRLGSGLAPARDLLEAGVPVGLAVDGSASNDSGHLLAEVRQAMLVARGRSGPSAMSARQALRVATRGSAACLGREDIGALEPGKRADVALFDLANLAYAGAEADPVAALVFCQSQRVTHLLVEGRWVVRDGELVTADEGAIGREVRRLATQILSGGRR